MGICGSKETLEPVSSGQSQPKRQEQKQRLQNLAGAGTQQDNGQKSQSSNSTEISSEKQDKAVQKAKPAAGSVSLEKEVKVLLLGSGESGKSTVVKQMKILHQNGFSKEELFEYKPFVYKNVLDCIKNVITAIQELEPSLISGATDNGEVTETPQEFSGKGILDKADIDDIMDFELPLDTEETFDIGIAQKITKLYSTPEVQHFIQYQQGNFYLIDSTSYFLSDLDRIAQPNYIPSVDDVLRTRKKTSGIFDFNFNMGSGLNIHMFDVGGQRSERKKWIHCFDNVTLIIFCVALSEYDQVLLEENKQNRLKESLALFDSVVNSRWFARTSIVLFLNKIDVFAKKLPYSPLENHFPDYNGGNNINKAAKYILYRFNQVNRSGLNIYPHVTQATDTSNIELVFAAVKETILENSLRDSGIL